MVCRIPADGELRLKNGSVDLAKLGTAAYVEVRLAAPVDGCAHPANAPGNRLWIWGQHFARK